MTIKTYLSGVVIVGGLGVLAMPAMAETTEEMCNRISVEWQSTGDVAAQCSCLGSKGDADTALHDEIWAITKTASNDEEAYEQASDALKAVLDSCAVEHE